MSILKEKTILKGKLFGYDCSGSTGNKKEYHDQSQQIVNSVDNPDDNLSIVKWDDRCVLINKYQLSVINNDRRGFGGTYPQRLCEFIKENNFTGDLILMTDGDIYINDVRRCSELLQDWKFNSVSVYITGSGTMNESISCSFTRNSPHRIEIRNTYSLESEIIEVTNDDYAFLEFIEEIKDVAEFMKISDKIKNTLISVNMGTSGNKTLYEKLIKLKNKLIKNQSEIKDNAHINEICKDYEDNTELDVAKLNKIWDEYYIKNSNEWIKQIDSYISWCNGGLSSVFSRKEINGRIQRAEISETVKPETVNIVNNNAPVVNENVSHKCPITLEFSENIIILMKKNGQSIFDNLSNDEINSIINCPLNALRNKNLVDYLKTLFDCVISIEAYKDLCDYGISDSSPLTREDIYGGLCLGNDKSHVLATNSTIRNILTLGKSLGNIDLWYAVLYFMIENGYVEHLKEYLPNLREHMVFRLRNSKSYMCLSGLPTFPTYKVHLGLCLWTVINSTSCSSELIKNPKNDPLRLHLSYSDKIIELLKLINIETSDEIKRHILRLKTLRTFLNIVKKNRNQNDIEFNIEKSIEALQYNGQKINNQWIFLDGIPEVEQILKAKNELPTICNELEISEIIDIYNLCDVNKAEADIYLPFDYQIKEFVFKNTKNWGYGKDVPKTTVHISKNTCRPFYNIKGGWALSNICTWEDNAKKIYGEKFMSLDNMLGSYISTFCKYPTKKEFIIHIFNHYYRKGTKTLPICIKQFIDEIFEDHDHVVSILEPTEFKKRWDSSVEIKKRVRIEYE